jgi:hypothetical protein
MKQAMPERYESRFVGKSCFNRVASVGNGPNSVWTQRDKVANKEPPIHLGLAALPELSNF